MAPPQPRKDRWLEILPISKRSTGAETSSAVTWKGGDLLVWLLRTYCQRGGIEEGRLCRGG